MTLLLVLASAFVGVILLRVQGFAVIRRMQDATRTGSDPGREVIGGALLFVAAILLIVPGFVSDVIGLLLFLPLVRNGVAAYLRKRMTIVTAASGRTGTNKTTRENHGPRGASSTSTKANSRGRTTRIRRKTAIAIAPDQKNAQTALRRPHSGAYSRLRGLEQRYPHPAERAGSAGL